MRVFAHGKVKVMDSYIYYCDVCNKLFKAGGIGKTIKCSTCSKKLIDLCITSDQYNSLESAAREELKKKAAESSSLDENAPTKAFQLANLDNIDITSWDFEALKEELSRALSVYKTTVYTDETIKLAKDDKAKLAKAKKAIDDQRKAFKAKCLMPYEAIEPQIKEITSMIEEQREAIDEVVRDFTDRKKSEKEIEVRAYYEKKAHVLGKFADSLYEKILDQKWLTASSGTKYREEMQVKINTALADIRTLESLESPFFDTILEKYIETFSVELAKQKHEELTAAASKAGLEKQNSQMPGTVSANEQAKSSSVDISENGILVRMYGKQNQVDQVMDFAKAIGVRIEIQ